MTFFDPGPLRDGDLKLVVAATVDEVPAEQQAPYYRFAMRHAVTEERMGRISLRITDAEFFHLYAGHIGYAVESPFRGNRYASRAVRLLIPLARRHGFRELWITCNPENIASRRTCELAGAEYVETVNVPSWTEIYQRGERRKCRYRLLVSGSPDR